MIGLVLSLQSNAALNVTSNNITAGEAVFIASGCVVESIMIVSTNAAVIKLFDGPSTNVVAAKTNITTFPTNQVTTFVTTTGITNTFTNNVLYTLVQSGAQVTNNVNPLLVTFVAANSAPLVLNTPFVCSSNLTYNISATGVSLSVNYRLP